MPAIFNRILSLTTAQGDIDLSHGRMFGFWYPVTNNAAQVVCSSGTTTYPLATLIAQQTPNRENLIKILPYIGKRCALHRITYQLIVQMEDKVLTENFQHDFHASLIMDGRIVHNHKLFVMTPLSTIFPKFFKDTFAGKTAQFAENT